MLYLLVSLVTVICTVCDETDEVLTALMSCYCQSSLSVHWSHMRLTERQDTTILHSHQQITFPVLHNSGKLPIIGDLFIYTNNFTHIVTVTQQWPNMITWYCSTPCTDATTSGRWLVLLLIGIIQYVLDQVTDIQSCRKSLLVSFTCYNCSEAPAVLHSLWPTAALWVTALQ